MIERKKPMARLRWEWALFVCFMLATVLIMSSSRYDLITLLIVIAIPAALLFPGVVATVVRGGRTLVQAFTWWEGLWLLLFISGLVFRQRTNYEIEGEALDSWALFRVGCVAVAAAILLLKAGVGRSAWPSYLFRGLVAWLAAYSLVCLLSSLWSVFPSWTLYRSCEYFVDVASLAAVVASARSAEHYRRLFDWTWIMLGLLMLSAWIGLLVRPQDALIPSEGIFGAQLVGLMPNLSSNTLAELGAIFGVVAVSRLLQGGSENARRAWYGLLFTFGFATMVFSQGRSGILGFFAGVIIVLLLCRRVGIGLALAMMAAVVLAVNGNAWGLFSDYMRRGETEAQLYSLSDRLEWWSLAWPKILSHPFTGYGAFAGSRFFVMLDSNLEVGSIHSDWVETLVGTGLCGAIPALLGFLGTWRQLVRKVLIPLTPLERQLRIEAAGVLAVISVRSIFSCDILWHPPTVFFAILAYAQFLILRRKYKSALRATSLAAA